jgi:hypothetical protein
MPSGKLSPVSINRKIPVRKIVGLVPDLYRLNHPYALLQSFGFEKLSLFFIASAM